jgi:hypothetical protein
VVVVGGRVRRWKAGWRDRWHHLLKDPEDFMESSSNEHWVSGGKRGVEGWEWETSARRDFFFLERTHKLPTRSLGPISTGIQLLSFLYPCSELPPKSKATLTL